jgi:hypothetical protein
MTCSGGGAAGCSSVETPASRGETTVADDSGVGGFRCAGGFRFFALEREAEESAAEGTA